VHWGILLLERRKKPMKEAYCVELGKVITVDEAWAVLFGDEKDEVETRSLTFKCPDSNCRANFLPVNFEEHSFLSEMKFKLHLKAVHNPYCSVKGKSTLDVKVTSPEQAKELLFISLWVMYDHIMTRFEKIEKSIKA
jgi:hypothetical protein